MQVSFVLDAGRVHPVARQVTGAAVATGAMHGLLAGPTPAERDQGLSSAIPEGTELRGMAVKDRIAAVDVSGRFDDGGGTFSMSARVAQIVFTLTQFPTVDAVRFQRDGKPLTLLGGEGLVLERPQTRGDWEELAPPA